MPEAAPSEAPDPGRDTLRWAWAFQLGLLLLGTGLWRLHSRTAAWVFFVGGATSLVFWGLHTVFATRMLTPKARLRWFFGLLGMGKLALIAVVLREMMDRYPAEAVPLGTGLLLFVVALFLEAARLVVKGAEPIPPDADPPDPPTTVPPED